MPGGKGNITPADGRQFSKDYQPKNRRTSTKILSDLLLKNLESKKEVVMTGVDVETGEKRRFKVVSPTKDMIILALLQKAAKGDVSALREIFDRVEGKPVFTADVNLPGVQHIGFAGE